MLVGGVFGFWFDWGYGLRSLGEGRHGCFGCFGCFGRLVVFVVVGLIDGLLVGEE